MRINDPRIDWKLTSDYVIGFASMNENLQYIGGEQWFNMCKKFGWDGVSLSVFWVDTLDIFQLNQFYNELKLELKKQIEAHSN